MQTIDLLKHLLPSLSPKNSMDWRFLLPILPGIKILVVGQKCDELTQLFAKLEIESHLWDYDFSNPIKVVPFSLSQFDIVIAPYGFSGKGLSSNPRRQREIYQTMQRLLKPGGTILVGFFNNWRFQRKRNPAPYSSNPMQMTRLLQKAGYKDVKLYGAIPNLSIPDYILPLTRQTVGFWLEHQYWSKVPERLLPYLYSPIFTTVFYYFLPSYFAIATAPTN